MLDKIIQSKVEMNYNLILKQQSIITAMANKIDMLQMGIGMLKIRIDANEGLITAEEALKKIEDLTKGAHKKPSRPSSSKIVKN